MQFLRILCITLPSFLIESIDLKIKILHMHNVKLIGPRGLGHIVAGI